MERNQNLINWSREIVLLKEARILRLYQRDLMDDVVLETSIPTDDSGNYTEEAAGQIFAAAQADAIGINQQAVAYVVKAFKTAGSKGPLARFSFIVSPHETASTPDSVGVMSQLMRHLETRFKAADAAQNAMMSNAARMLEQSGETIDKLMADRHKLLNDRLDIVELVEGLHSQKHQRDLDSKSAANKMELGKELAENFKLLLPAVVNKLGGKANNNNNHRELPAHMSAKEAAINALLASLGSEQIQQLEKILTPAQLISLATVTTDE